MKDDIRRQTCVIIRKNGQCLVGHIMGTRELRWSIYAHEAWRTRDRDKAAEVAKKVGGIMVLFNPIVRQTKVIGA